MKNQFFKNSNFPSTIIKWNKLDLNIRNSETPKGALVGLREFLATESPLKIVKNAFYFTSKALFVLKVFNFSS